ncbi:hypothetical protein [Aeromonas veronii]|uniref:hypothetical protein n=1 Tax=Aeromonas veronii TaxID=654 RepID=UPI001960F656|nr:hypothetical protein [Aeromonas veronii]
MKKIMNKIWIGLSSFTFVVMPVMACTGLRLTAQDQGVVIGHIMEFGFDVESKVVIVPAGSNLFS